MPGAPSARYRAQSLPAALSADGRDHPAQFRLRSLMATPSEPTSPAPLPPRSRRLSATAGAAGARSRRALSPGLGRRGQRVRRPPGSVRALLLRRSGPDGERAGRQHRPETADPAHQGFPESDRLSAVDGQVASAYIMCMKKSLRSPGCCWARSFFYPRNSHPTGDDRGAVGFSVGRPVMFNGSFGSWSGRLYAHDPRAFPRPRR